MHSLRTQTRHSDTDTVALQVAVERDFDHRLQVHTHVDCFFLSEARVEGGTRSDVLTMSRNGLACAGAAVVG